MHSKISILIIVIELHKNDVPGLYPNSIAIFINYGVKTNLTTKQIIAKHVNVNKPNQTLNSEYILPKNVR